MNLFKIVKTTVTVRQATAAKRLLDGQMLPMVEARLNSLDRKEAA